MSKIIKNETKITSSLTIKISDAVEVETKTIDSFEEFIEFSREFYEKMKQMNESMEVGAILYAASEKKDMQYEIHHRRRVR